MQLSINILQLYETMDLIIQIDRLDMDIIKLKKYPVLKFVTILIQLL